MHMRLFISLLTGLLYLAAGLADLRAQNLPHMTETGPAGSLSSGQPATPPNPGINVNKLNFTRSFVPRVPLTDTGDVNEGSAPTEVQRSTEYRDGFNRTMLQLEHDFIEVNGIRKNLARVSDTRSRQDQVAYLPYTTISDNFSGNVFADQQDYYQSMYPEESGTGYALSRYQSASGYRQQVSYAAGKSQVGQYRGTTTKSVSNSANEVRIWVVNASGLPQSTGYYAGNRLIGSLSTDASGAEVRSYIGKDGHLVYKEVLLYTTLSGTDVLKTFARTYYVYDELGRLRFILPPKAAALGGTAPSSATLQNLCFEYRYDAQGRQVAQRQPGEEGFTELVYDQRQRPVMRRTALMAAQNQWEVSFYDKLGRVIATSLYNSSRARDWLQNMLDTTDHESTTYGPTAMVYYLVLDIGMGKYPSETDIYGNTMMSYTWYDHYGHATNAAARYDSTVSALNFTEYSQVAGAEVPVRSMRTQGRVVGGRTRLLPAPGANVAKTGKWRNSLSWYDDKGRPIYSNTIDSSNTTTAIHKLYSGTQYHFSYGALASKQVLVNQNSADGYTTHTELLYNKYEALTGRLQQVSHRLDEGNWAILASYAYDGMGRMRRKDLGLGGEVQDYTYNIRGQLTGINDYYAETSYKQGAKRSFGQSLKYDYGFDEVQYNGRVAGMVWRGSSGSTGPTTAHAYGYDYDKSGRLLLADYNQQVKNGLNIISWNKTSSDYTVSNLSYDLNGNLMSMKQRGVVPGTGPVDMDNLVYKYEQNEASNLLAQVTDQAGLATDLGDFKNGPAGTGYSYDVAGNLTQDENKGISNVSYNRFNKPEKITFTNGNTITYSYDAGGGKIQELRYDANESSTTRQDYIGNYVYRNDSLLHLYRPEGRSVFDAEEDSFEEEYFVKDHLGNVRSTISSKAYDPQEYLGSYEVASAALEGMFFDHHDPIRDDRPGGGGDNNYAGRLNGADEDRRTGTALLLKVMAGDLVGMQVNNYYENYEKGGDQPVDATKMLESIISTLTMGVGGFEGSEGHDPGMVTKLFTPANYSGAFQDILDSITVTNRPRAYLNYMFFNSKMELVPEASGAFQANGDNTWTEIGSPYPIEMPQNGYLAVFLSNASDGGSCYNCGDVFFDQVTITFSQGSLLEENHYYPHGLPMAALGSQSHDFSGSRHRYQGNEQLKELDLGWMDFHNRQYDPQIGRFLSIDPLAASGGQDRLSPFQAMGNNPVSMVDPLGLQSFHNMQTPANHMTVRPIPGSYSGGPVDYGPGSASNWFMYLGMTMYNQSIMDYFALNHAGKVSGNGKGHSWKLWTSIEPVSGFSISAEPVIGATKVGYQTSLNLNTGGRISSSAISALVGSSQQSNEIIFGQLGDIGTWIGTFAGGLSLIGDSRVSWLVRNNYRGGVSGNYQLIGRNLSSFGTRVTTYSMPTSKLLKYGIKLGRLGTAVSVGSLAYDGYQVYQNELSVVRFGYRLSGFGTSVVAGAAGGSAFSPGIGTAIGAGIGFGFAAGEIMYDEVIQPKVAEPFNSSFNDFIKGYFNIPGW